MTELTLAAILPGRRRGKSDDLQAATDRYLARAAQYLPSTSAIFESEEALIDNLSRQPGRAAGVLVLFDLRGQVIDSGEFARILGKWRDEGAQRIVFAIGPADGWSDTARKRANAVVSFGRVTLPHDLARVVAAEQIYRALTILAGHPYHCGH